AFSAQIFRSSGGGAWGAPQQFQTANDPDVNTPSTITLDAPAGPGLQFGFSWGAFFGRPPIAEPAANATGGPGRLKTCFTAIGVGDVPAGQAFTHDTGDTSAGVGGFFIPLDGAALPAYPFAAHY